MKIFNSGFIVNAYGLCEREVQIRVDPETAKSNIKC
jgi:hypothetical protein